MKNAVNRPSMDLTPPSLRPATALVLALLVIAAMGAQGPSTAAAEPPPKFDPPKAYYLALGDSVTYGLPSGVGYVDDFANRLRELKPRHRDLVTVNYGCPGESTDSSISGTCPWTDAGRPLHDSFSGSQLAAAVAFLRAHRGRVSPITLTLWGNDVAALVDSCGGELACVQSQAPGAIQHLSSNLATILSRLRTAAPSAEIIVTGPWDSFVGSFPEADPLFQALNYSMAMVAADARARYADIFPTFNPQGDIAVETATFCTMTLICSTGDSHPSDLGYETIADIAFDASGYARRGQGRP